MSTLVPFLLRSLKYPRVEGFNPDDPAQFQALLVWLENTKVRQYPIDGRKQLQSANPSEWQAAFQKYLQDIDCPVQFNGGNHRAVLQWLLTHAVGLEYQDSAEPLNQATQRVEAEGGAPEEWSEQQLPPLPDITTDAVRAALLQLQRLLHANGQHSASTSAAAAAPEATPEGLQKAHAMLETCVLPALAELEKKAQHHQQPGAVVAAAAAAAASAAGGSSGGGGAGAGAGGAQGQQRQQPAVAAMLAQYPLGFSTGDSTADLAATILRMLYIKDLRALQTLVDSALVQVQEYTANPRTDASLGRVGR